MNPEPTQAQLDARLNPTAYTSYIPKSGVFRGTSGGSTLYNRVGNDFYSFDAVSLLSDTERQAAGDYGSQSALAINKLQSQYGLDYNSLSQVNLADFNQSLSKEGLGWTDANGSYHPPEFKSGTLNEFFQSQTIPSSFTPATIVPQQNNTTQNTVAAPTTATAVPTTTLQPGMTGDAVKQLQDYLVKSGYMTQAQVDTGYGTYGPQTTAAVKTLQEKLGVDNSTGVGYFGPRTIAAASGQTTTPAVSSIGNPVTAPSGSTGSSSSGSGGSLGSSGGPTLSNPTAASAFDATVQSLTAQLASLKTAFETENAKRTQDYQTQIDALNKKQADLQVLQDNGMAENLKVTTEEVRQKNEALTLEKQRFDENYNANQTLVNELDGLLTTGNQIVEQMKGTTGLSSIMEPRIQKTISDVTARAGVIQAVLAARNGQIGLAQSQLGTTFDAVTSIAKDQITYYNTLEDFYQNQKDDNGKKLATLTADQKTYLDQKLLMLNQDLADKQATAKVIEKAMLDPDTALAYAKAGVSFNDSVPQIAAKLATYAYSKEVAGVSNKMALDGYSTTPIAGVTPVQTVDSQGVTKSWYKTPSATGSDPLKTVDYSKADQFISSNPNASYDELKNGLLQYTKLTSTEIDAKLAGSGIKPASTTKATVFLTPENITAVAQALVKSYGANAAEAVKTTGTVNVNDKDVKLSQEQIDAIIAEIGKTSTAPTSDAKWYNPFSWF